MTVKHKPRKAKLHFSYLVRDKSQVDEMKNGFEMFLKRCTIFDLGPDTGPDVGDIPVTLVLDEDGGLVVNLDPSCEVAVHDFDSVVSVIYNIGEIRITLKGGEHFRVRVGVM